VLFLLRPRQTAMPYALPRSREQQELYNEQLHKAYASTRRLAPAQPSPRRDAVAELKELVRLRDAGALSDAEFTAAKVKILGDDDTASGSA
jgi:hypothetical protein